MLASFLHRPKSLCKQVRSFIISFPPFLLLGLMGEVALLMRIWLGSCILEGVVSRKAWLEDNPLELFSLRVHRQQRVSMMTQPPTTTPQLRLCCLCKLL